MNQTIETLMDEHRLIEQVLGSLATFAEQLERGQALPREAVARYAAFFKEFADKCHHGKEEERLFVKMNRVGFPPDQGPIAVMLMEHGEGRHHVGALAEIGRGAGPLPAAESQQVVEHARAYIPLLLAHIQKEDRILYPLAMRCISPADFDEMEKSCQAFDREVVGQDAIQRLKALAQELVSQFPPDPQVITEQSGCFVCGGH